MTVDRVDFVVVGCQRCGTTWLDAALREIPGVHLPDTKQSYFFDRNWDEGVAWWAARFEGAPEDAVVGEVATGYSLPHAVDRMADTVPQAKLIMVMRHPIERAYSNFQTRRAEEGWASFEDALERSGDLVERGMYADQLEHLRRRYPEDRILTLLYDDLRTDDRAYLDRVLDFLGLEPGQPCSLIGQRKNAATFPRLRHVLHRVGLKPLVRALSKSPVGDLVRRRMRRSGRRSDKTLDPATRARLVEVFRDSNDRLARMIERDLSHWNA